MAVRIRDAFAQPVFGAEPKDFMCRISFTNEDGITADFDLPPRAMSQLAESVVGVLYMRTIKYPNFCFEHMEEH